MISSATRASRWLPAFSAATRSGFVRNRATWRHGHRRTLRPARVVPAVRHCRARAYLLGASARTRARDVDPPRHQHTQWRPARLDERKLTWRFTKGFVDERFNIMKRFAVSDKLKIFHTIPCLTDSQQINIYSTFAYISLSVHLRWLILQRFVLIVAIRSLSASHVDRFGYSIANAGQTRRIKYLSFPSFNRSPHSDQYPQQYNASRYNRGDDVEDHDGRGPRDLSESAGR